jgi:hypothetical protein
MARFSSAAELTALEVCSFFIFGYFSNLAVIFVIVSLSALLKTATEAFLTILLGVDMEMELKLRRDLKWTYRYQSQFDLLLLWVITCSSLLL